MGTMGNLIFLIITGLLCSGLTLGQHFSYANADDWKEVFSTCGDNEQSPVDIGDNLIPFTPKYPINFKNYGDMEATFKKSDHSYIAAIQYPKGHNNPAFLAPLIAGGDLPGSYVLEMIHFHWGSSSARGAEHTINGCAPAAEMHLVHYKKEYGNVSTAIYKDDGLAVLGVWLVPGPKPNQKNSDNTESADSYFGGDLSSGYNAQDHQAATWEWFKEMTPEEGHLPNESEESDDNGSEKELYLRQLLPFDASAFYRYNGSLTTPPCTEHVEWTIFAEPLIVPDSFLKALRSLQLVDNFRPVQKLGKRKILFSGDVSNIRSPCSKQCGYSLPQFEVKQEGKHTCWATHTQIGVDVSNVTAGLKQAPSLEWSIGNNCATAGLINTGSSLKVVYSETAPNWFLSGGELKSEYQLAHIDVLGGSRHSLDSVEYPMELQMVLFMTKYGTLTDALKQPDGVLVLTRFFEAPLSEWTTVDNDKFLSDIINDEAPDSTKKAYWSSASPNVSSLIGDMSIYYQYHGNDGNCNRGITWMVMHSAEKISRKLLKTFEGLLKTDSNNIRKTEVIKLDPSKLTLRVNSLELYESYKGFMGITDAPGSGSRILGNGAICLYAVALAVVKGVHMLI